MSLCSARWLNPCPRGRGRVNDVNSMWDWGICVGWKPRCGRTTVSLTFTHGQANSWALNESRRGTTPNTPATNGDDGPYLTKRVTGEVRGTTSTSLSLPPAQTHSRHRRRARLGCEPNGIPLLTFGNTVIKRRPHPSQLHGNSDEDLPPRSHLRPRGTAEGC